MFANVDDYEIATSTCRTEGVSEMETYGLKLLVRGQPMVEIPTLTATVTWWSALARG